MAGNSADLKEEHRTVTNRIPFGKEKVNVVEFDVPVIRPCDDGKAADARLDGLDTFHPFGVLYPSGKFVHRNVHILPVPPERFVHFQRFQLCRLPPTGSVFP